LQHYLVQYTAFATIGRFTSPESRAFSRGDEVVLRTERGVELGRTVTSVDASEDLPEGTILRAVTEQDRMLADRLERNRLDALRDCELRLKEHGLH
jgi:cell fate regulator YaaT (PSP1 superfamily)